MKSNNGFNLIELLIVIAIISLLSVMAIPIYTSHLAKAKRLQVENQLVQISTALERYHIEQNSYAGATLEKLGEKNPDAYQIVIASADDTNFILQAIPNSSQKSHDQCGTLELTSTQKKSACW